MLFLYGMKSIRGLQYANIQQAVNIGKGKDSKTEKEEQRTNHLSIYEEHYKKLRPIFKLPSCFISKDQI